jgi:molybdopterin/thiamine biosynthesis adenylyltransferase
MSKEAIRGRFKDAPWFPKKEVSTVVGGAGGIGSWLSFLLARAGFNPVIYDYDIVEEHNIGGQLFSKQHIGMYKIDAIKSIILDFADVDIMAFNSKFDTTSMAHQFMFAAFDNMQARKDMFEIWWRDNHDNPNAILIDGRLLMEQIQIFCVTPENAKEYQTEHLFDDSEVEAENCTMKQTSHSASMIASLMVGFFTNHYTNVVKQSVVRQVPFFHEYFIPINLTS